MVVSILPVILSHDLRYKLLLRCHTTLLSGVLLAVLSVFTTVNKALALTCVLCNAVNSDNQECWTPPSPPKKVTQCSTGACRSHLVYVGPEDPLAKDGQASRLSVLRECAQVSDDGRRYFLDRMKQRQNGTSAPKVYCVTKENPCQLDCYCAEDLCNTWTNDKLAEAGQQRLGSADMAEQLRYSCIPAFNRTDAETSSGTTICSFRTAVLRFLAIFPFVRTVRLCM